jgi:hypothetical protein
MIQRYVNLVRRLFDSRPDDTPNAPIDDPRVSKWYRSIGLFEGQRKKKPLTLHLLQSHDKREFAILVNGKDLQTITNRSAIRVANRFLKNG